MFIDISPLSLAQPKCSFSIPFGKDGREIANLVQSIALNDLIYGLDWDRLKAKQSLHKQSAN